MVLTGHIAHGRVHDTNIAALKPGERPLPEYEVCGSNNLAVNVQLFLVLSQDSVLKATEGAAVVAAAVKGGDCNGLRSLASRVLHVDVVELEVGRVNPQGASLIVVDSEILAEACDNGGTVPRVTRVIRSVAINCQTVGVVDQNLFGVGALIQVNATTRRGGVNGLLDGREIAAVSGHSGAARRSAGARRGKGPGGQGQNGGVIVFHGVQVRSKNGRQTRACITRRRSEGDALNNKVGDDAFLEGLADFISIRGHTTSSYVKFARTY